MHVFHWDRRAGAQSRLLLALKTAIAAGLAWVIAQAVPGAAAHYPYYAPLGAVIATGPTVLHGIREGFRTVLGLAIGIGLALIVELIGAPHYLTVPIAVGVAILAAGFRIVGEANTWVVSAAILVLLIGGRDPGDYSIGYLIQTLVGAVVGIGVNILIFPPLAVREAELELAALNGRLADHLEDLASALEDDLEGDGGDGNEVDGGVDGGVDGDAWAERLDRLQADALTARGAVRRADESRRGNPRGLRTEVRAEIDSDFGRLRGLERAIFASTDLTDILGQASPVTQHFGGVDEELVPAFAEALRRVADAVRAGAERDGERTPELQGAQEALAALQTELDKEGRAHPSEVPMSTAATVALRNVVVALSPPSPGGA